MDVAELFAMLSGKETAEAYDALKRLEAISDGSDAVYPYIDDMISMLKSEKYVIRVRGFRLLCMQARWDSKGKIDEAAGEILRALDNEKPTAVRQYLQYLKYVAQHKAQLRETVKNAALAVDVTGFKDTMRPLIEKDIQNLVQYIDEL